ncbi:MAG: glycosyltransferase family 2 protein [Gemella sp.]|nr:glycosyltransferase family 2 protein [Gemella sp.]
MSKILTVTVPSYNTEKYIDECLPTLLDERINDKIEILMVNDGSSDGTSAKAKTYEARYPNTIKVVDKENGGHGSTINKGIELATGKFFKVIDGDDWVNTEEFVAFVENLEKVDADIVVNPYEDHNMDTNTIKVQEYPVDFNTVYSYDELLGKANRLPMMHATTFRTSILKENNITIDEKMFYVDMEYIIFPMKHLETAIYLPQKVYCYRMGTREQSVSPENFVKNRHMHRHVTLRLIETYNDLQKVKPGSVRVEILKNQLLYEVVLDTRIIYHVSDLSVGKTEFLEYKDKVLSTNKFFWKNANSKNIKILTKTNGFLFSLVAKRARKASIR